MTINHPDVILDGHTLRLRPQGGVFAGIVIKGAKIVARVNADLEDEAWRLLHDAAARLNPKFIGYSGARARFTDYFPGGFASSHYAAQERKYKLDAKQRLEAVAPLQVAMTFQGAGEAVLKAFNTNLIDQFAKMRIRDLLRGPDANAFVRHAAAFAMSPSPQSLKALRAILRPHNCDRWTTATYLPFLWRPDVHFFLKPEFLTDFAARVGHPFAETYRPELEFDVYEGLLDLVEKTRSAIADLAPADLIDVQSFMWTVIKYTPEDKLRAMK